MTLSIAVYSFVVIMIAYIVKGLVGFGDPLLSIPAALIGMWIGGCIDRHIDETQIRRIIIYVFILGGLSVLVKALLSM